MKEKPVFELLLTQEARDFLKSLSKDVRSKIGSNIRRIQKGERNLEIFKKLENSDIWEFRTLYNKVAYRLFAFWDTESNTLVVATHGIVKKTQKTPRQEIERAKKYREDYLTRKERL